MSHNTKSPHAVHGRTMARRYALQILYSLDLNPASDTDPAETVTEQVSGKNLAFAEALIARVQTHQEEIDQIISAHLRKWSLSQLNVVDKNILRIGVAELLFQEEHPLDRGIVINEAVKLAKNFGGDTSYRFINAILNAVAEEHQL